VPPGQTISVFLGTPLPSSAPIASPVVPATTDQYAGSVRVPTLFNLDALFELVVGLALLFNPLLGPVLPIPGWVVVMSALGLLVAACVLGRAGMGKGGLVTRIRTVAMINLAGAALLTVWAFVSCQQGGRVFVLIVAGGLAALGGAQLFAQAGPSPRLSGTARRGTIEELQGALRSGSRNDNQ
jgi:hypothetical protein